MWQKRAYISYIKNMNTYGISEQTFSNIGAKCSKCHKNTTVFDLHFLDETCTQVRGIPEWKILCPKCNNKQKIYNKLKI
jgi:ribosomal protein S27E